jgi:hypothetical protein
MKMSARSTRRSSASRASVRDRSSASERLPLLSMWKGGFSEKSLS